MNIYHYIDLAITKFTIKPQATTVPQISLISMEMSKLAPLP